MEALFQFDLEMPRPGLRVLTFECDSSLRPCEVVATNVESWQMLEGAQGTLPHLQMRLREALPAGSETVTIRCLAPLGDTLQNTRPQGSREQHHVAWSSPAMRLVRVASSDIAPEQTGRIVTRGETLEVRAHPEVRLESWQAGAFRLLNTTTKTDGPQKRPFQCLTLLGGGVEPDSSGARRPSARLQAGGIEFRARQAAWWQVAPEQSLLTLQVAYEVTHGQLFQLPVQLPAGWDIERVETTPANLARTWSVRPDYPEKGAATLLVELQRPLTPDETKREQSGTGTGAARPRGPTLTVRLHPVLSATPSRQEMKFPDAIPLGTRFREGSLGIEFDEQTYQSIIKSSVPESEADADGPWGKRTPDFFYSYRGQPVTGMLLLRPRARRVRGQMFERSFLWRSAAA